MNKLFLRVFMIAFPLLGECAVERVGARGFYNAFARAPTLETVNFSKVVFVDREAFCKAFQDCPVLHNVYFSALPVVGIRSFTESFKNCKSLQKIAFPAVEKIEQEGFAECFSGCEKLELVEFYNLCTVDPSGFRDAFAGCSSLKAIHFEKVQTPFDIGLARANVYKEQLKIYVSGDRLVEWRNLNSKYAECFVFSSGLSMVHVFDNRREPIKWKSSRIVTLTFDIEENWFDHFIIGVYTSLGLIPEHRIPPMF